MFIHNLKVELCLILIWKVYGVQYNKSLISHFNSLVFSKVLLIKNFLNFKKIQDVLVCKRLSIIINFDIILSWKLTFYYIITDIINCFLLIKLYQFVIIHCGRISYLRLLHKVFPGLMNWIIKTKFKSNLFILLFVCKYFYSHQ